MVSRSLALMSLAAVLCSCSPPEVDGVTALSDFGGRSTRDMGTLPPAPEASPPPEPLRDAGEQLGDVVAPSPDQGEPCDPQPERCNGADDDCDGSTDEDFELGAVCSSQEGGCVVEGVLACNAAGVFCDISGAAPAMQP